MKKTFFFSIAYVTQLQYLSAQQVPGVNSSGLPFDNDTELGVPDSVTSYDNDPFERFIDFFIGYFIQLVAVIAVLALMISGIQLILSGGEEEKFKKAKTWFTWSLVGVVLSLMAYYIINFINRLTVGG